jgi:hypothetical protein
MAAYPGGEESNPDQPDCGGSDDAPIVAPAAELKVNDAEALTRYSEYWVG